MSVAHNAQAVLMARLVNHETFTRTAEEEGRNDDVLAGGNGCDELVPFVDSCWEIWVSS